MTVRAKVITNETVRREKSLRVASRFEPPNRSLSLARWLMRILGPIVQTFVLAVLYTGQQLLFGCCIAAQLIGDQHAWDVLTSFQQLAKEFLGRSFVAAALEKDIEHIPMLINRAPEVVVLAIDGEEYFVKLPLVSGLRSPLA